MMKIIVGKWIDGFGVGMWWWKMKLGAMHIGIMVWNSNNNNIRIYMYTVKYSIITVFIGIGEKFKKFSHFVGFFGNEMDAIYLYFIRFILNYVVWRIKAFPK